MIRNPMSKVSLDIHCLWVHCVYAYFPWSVIQGCENGGIVFKPLMRKKMKSKYLSVLVGFRKTDVLLIHLPDVVIECPEVVELFSSISAVNWMCVFTPLRCSWNLSTSFLRTVQVSSTYLFHMYICMCMYVYVYIYVYMYSMYVLNYKHYFL